MLAGPTTARLRVALGGRALRLASAARAVGGGVGAVGVPARSPARDQAVCIPFRCLAMFHSISSLARFLPAVGPSLLYGPLALACAWSAISLGWHSPGAFVYSGLALFFGTIVVQEWCLVTASGPVP